jgi:branched-chain amino acid transport system ATP-binding protein
MTTMLDIRDIHSYYGNIHALKGISLTVGENEIVTLIGANGAGKSTTLNTICGLVRPREGEIWLRDEPLHKLKAHDIVRRGVAQVPEGRKIFGRMTVTENLEMGAFTRTDKAAIQEDMERVFDLFPRLKERRRQSGGTLSGGEQQMLAMGRGLMARPLILLLDEPSMGLAPVLVEKIFETIVEINQQGTPVLLVEQNALMALSIAHRGYVLQTGRIVLQDTASALQQNEMVRKAYLGED